MTDEGGKLLGWIIWSVMAAIYSSGNKKKILEIAGTEALKNPIVVCMEIMTLLKASL